MPNYISNVLSCFYVSVFIDQCILFDIQSLGIYILDFCLPVYWVLDKIHLFTSFILTVFNKMVAWKWFFMLANICVIVSCINNFG